ncbi:MAG: transglutaminase family protein [Patulibacter sp.]
MNYDIHYRIEYRYSGPVSDNLNTLRVRPTTNSSQRCDEFRVRLAPEARITRHLDYFGAEVLEFGVTRPHDRLLIDVNARVATSAPTEPPAGTWQQMSADPYQLAGVEYLLPAPDQPDDAAIASLADTIRRDSPLDTALALCQVIPDEFKYLPGATYVGSTITDLLTGRAGVCQDFAHLALVLLRYHGIAARYVSGYLFSTGEHDGQPVAADIASVEVATHAWVEALLPGGDGGGEPQWVGLDPTNRQLVGEAHVKIGHGRHYSDVPPTKGVYFGSASSIVDAKVTMTRLDPSAAL